MAQIPNLQTLSPDFSPAFEAKRARWYCVLGLRLPRESRVSGVAATRLTAVPRDNVVTGRTPNRAYPPF